MPPGKLLIILHVISMAIIAIVDFIMGDRAQTLNAYEILRRSVTSALGLKLPKVTDRYILFQDWWGSGAIFWAWFLYLLWAFFFAVILFLIIRALVPSLISAD